ncbi:MAG: diacylglycerol/lipid kinase family protein [Gemmatimonadaceae bacterium]
MDRLRLRLLPDADGGGHLASPGSRTLQVSLWIIANPASGRGRGKRILREIRLLAAEFPELELTLTGAAGDEEAQAQHAISSGARVIIVVGGDGTCSQVANSILRARASCALTVIPSGTGNDFAKTIGLSDRTPREIIELALSGATARIDVGLVDEHYFLNTCGFGFDPAVLEETERVHFLRGESLYIYAALRKLFEFESLGVSVRGDDTQFTRKLLMLVASNGQYLGGAFRIAPNASVKDGALDLCFISDASVIGRARLFARAFRGTHVSLPSVETAHITRIKLDFLEAPIMEIDGELHRARSPAVTIESLPRALSVIAAPGFPR